jgi:hypothetical protein
MNWAVASPGSWQKLFQHCAKLHSRIDLLVLLPMESGIVAVEPEPLSDAGLARTNAFYPNILNQAKLYGLGYQLMPSHRVLALPRAPLSTDQRVQLVRQALSTI